MFQYSNIEQEMLDVKLVVVGGATEGEVMDLELPAVLGRCRDATLRLNHPLVSRNHCEITARDGHLFVRDLASTNGTFVGSQRVEEAVLLHGELLTIGTVTFRAQYPGVPPEEGHAKDGQEIPAQTAGYDASADETAAVDEPVASVQPR